MINVIQPAIVLLNPGRDEGSLSARPNTKDADEEAKYWGKRAFVYRMSTFSTMQVHALFTAFFGVEPGEHFYKRVEHPHSNSSASSNSTVSYTDEQLCDPNDPMDIQRP